MPKRIVTVEHEGRRLRIEVPVGATTSEIEGFVRGLERTGKSQAQEREIAQEKFEREEAGTINPFRPQVRQFMEGLPAEVRFGAEMAPSIAGGFLGGAGGPAGVAGGSAVAELLAQEIGIAPRSTAGVVMSGAAPLGVSAARRLPALAGGAARLFPGIKEAIVKREIEQASKWTDDVAGMLGAKPAKPLWEALRQSGVRIPRENLARTAAALDEVIEEASKKADAFPEARDVAGLAKSIRDTLLSERGPRRMISTPGTGGHIRGGGVSLPGKVNPEPDIAEIHSNMSSLGRQIGMLEGKGGLPEGARKKLFGSLIQDLESIPAITPEGQAVSLLSQARQATKTGFAIDSVDNVIQGSFGKPGIDGKAVFDASAALRKIRNMTNPKHAAYDKNFTDGLGPSGIEKLEQNLEKIAGLNATPLGPGKLIISGVWAGVGYSIGSKTGLPLAGEMGSLVGVNVPGAITKALLSKGGGEMLDRLIRLGKGEISDRALNVLAQGLRKSVEDRETSGNIIRSFTGAVPSGAPAEPFGPATHELLKFPGNPLTPGR